MSAHTKGPWDHNIPEEGTFTDDKEYRTWGGIEIYSGIDIIVAELNIQELPISEFEANARLIAAAPEMLEALERIIGNFSLGKDGECHQAIVNARVVLAKARGET